MPMTTRRMLFLLSLVSLSLSAAISAQADDLLSGDAVARAKRLSETALAGSGAYAIVEELTTEIGPRLAGSDGDRRAVEWAIAKFKALGYDKVWTEPVTFPVWERGFEAVRVIKPYPQAFAIAALGGSVGTPDEGITGEVVAFDSYEALLKGSREQVDGKIVYIGNRMRRAKDGRGYGEAVSARSAGASKAAALGAKAILIRSIGTDANSRTPHTGMLSYDIAFRKIPGAALSNPDADLLEAMLKRDEPVELEIRLGAGIRGEYTSQNVIGEVTGRDGGDKVVLIGGHLDSWDLGTGAIDDGAGVAITMAAGKLLLDLPKDQRPRHNVRVVAWANEEQGVYGGKAYGEAHKDAVDDHLIGFESDFGAGRVWRFDSRVPEAALPLMDAIGDVLAPLGIERGGNEAGGGADVYAMRQLGMPVASLVQDGTEYFDHHHTANDTLDKVDARDLDQNVAAYVILSYLVAEQGVPGGRLPAARAAQ
jgi:carboxypeptidase Q